MVKDLGQDHRASWFVLMSSNGAKITSAGPLSFAASERLSALLSDAEGSSFQAYDVDRSAWSPNAMAYPILEGLNSSHGISCWDDRKSESQEDSDETDSEPSDTSDSDSSDEDSDWMPPREIRGATKRRNDHLASASAMERGCAQAIPSETSSKSDIWRQEKCFHSIRIWALTPVN